MRERLGATDLAGVRSAYNAVYARTEYGDREVLYARIFRLLKLQPGDRLCDVACGAGNWLEYCASRGVEVEGCELSDEALGRARRRVPDARLWLADGAALPLADDSRAILTCLGSLEHFLDPAAGARELARVLAPGGRAVIMLPNAYYSGDLWRVLRTGYGPNHHQVIDRFASCHEWRDLLTEAGLRPTRIERYDKGKWWKRLWPFHFAYHFLYIIDDSSGPDGPEAPDV